MIAVPYILQLAKYGATSDLKDLSVPFSKYSGYFTYNDWFKHTSKCKDLQVS